MDKEYDVFISYSRKDYVDAKFNVIPGNVVSKIKDALTETGISYWFDEEGIYSGQNFVEKIVTNIEASKIFLFLSTANSNDSRWTCKEIASADEYGKHIIPVRIDQTPYNKKVLFRIADLDYIEYFSNPEKGMEDMIESIKTYLAQLDAEEKRNKKEEERRKEEDRRKAEEAKRKKEEEEKRQREEQKKIIADIKLECNKLNNEEAKLELERDNLLLKTEKILDKEQHDALREQIQSSSPIHLKFQKEQVAMKDKLESQKQSINKLETTIEAQNDEIQNKDAQIALLQTKLNTKDVKSKNKIKNSVFISILSVLIIGIIGLLSLWLYEYSEKKEYNDKYCVYLYKYRKAEETIDALSASAPFVVTDIEVRNDGEEWGDKIYSNKSTYFRPRIKYVGFRNIDCELGVRIFNTNGSLSTGENSPNGYSYFETVPIVEGVNYSDKIAGWGSKNPGHWPAGTYRIQICYQDKIMGDSNFEVY